jgi:hypothetical protein
VMMQAMRQEKPFSVMQILRLVNGGANEPLTVVQVLGALKRMASHGLLERRALGQYSWKS